MGPPESAYEMTSPMDDIATVVLPRQVDSETSASVEALIIDALRPGGSAIVDGNEVAYMSAAGVRAFARALHHAEEIGAHIAFCRFTGAAADCLLVSGFTQLFDVVESVAEAAERLRRKPAGPAEERLHPHGRAG
jgi:anti-sigma B factor antagonist